jgi:glutaconyl-CoA/methylmalonyl-CoA decarboxylase subunit gamma
MKYTVTVDSQTFEVEVNDTRARPIIAIVNGRSIEVWPEEAGRAQPGANGSSGSNGSSPAAAPVSAVPAASAPASSALQIVRAPIPGVITAINAQPGAAVKAGDQLCLLEAMKMNNSIRSSLQGVIAKVNVSVGQTVKHGETLFEFED